MTDSHNRCRVQGAFQTASRMLVKSHYALQDSDFRVSGITRKPARDSSGPASVVIPETLAPEVLFLHTRGDAGDSNDLFPLAISGPRANARSPEPPVVSV